MNKYVQNQTLLNMKFHLTNLYSLYNNLSNQINNAEIFNIIIEMYNISFQILNFGIQLLNFGIKYTSIIMKDYNLKEQADNIINQLNNIKFNFEENIKPVYNIVFNERGLKTTICWRGTITIKEMIEKYLIKKGIDLSEIHSYRFFYKCVNLNDDYEFINKSVGTIFTPYSPAQIEVSEYREQI